ncbi:benzaldehyde dehydrogenase [Pseudomonas sp. sia0905]|uniref:benzaldehyde dehydrogenase n=1 Tax=Pseudomonas sp. sia0905 TaxID=2854783 RepID=UPI001C4908F1|nr:benzaldehyde dehydrogenase [Pseudomonas sp. sia0905]MBV7563199.1 benzaldehyde dehydrogenase [Pseudomonas sp. sia0905]
MSRLPRSESNPALLDEQIWEARLFSGTWRTPIAGGRNEVSEPATGKCLATTGQARAEDVAMATAAAAAQQPAWEAVPPRQRADIFLRAAQLLQAQADECALFIARETGGILPKAQHEVREAVLFLQLAAGQVMQPHGLVLPSNTGTLSYARRLPHGVVGVISPFNFPLILSIRAVAPALAAGNAVVLKPDPQTPIAGGFLIARLFELAGLPEGVLHVLPGGADAGAALCSDPHVRMISFTGSTAAGRKVAETAGRHLKKVALELGGKNPLIILEDADLERALSCASWGAFLHQGQICMASGLILVHESLHERFVEGLVERARHLRVGDPAGGDVQLGPMINENQLVRTHQLVLDSVVAGAHLHTGGQYDGLFYQPTVLSHLTPGMPAFDTEMFGPVACVASFANDEEAIDLANRTEYGLAAAVISCSVGRAMAVGAQLRAGMLHINDQTVNDDGVNPFGGRGNSGNGGSMSGPANWDEFTQWQWVTVKDTPPQYPF